MRLGRAVVGMVCAVLLSAPVAMPTLAAARTPHVTSGVVATRPACAATASCT